MRAVSDTSPLSYLLLIGESALLPVLYERLYIPEAVARERDPETKNGDANGRAPRQANQNDLLLRRHQSQPYGSLQEP